MAGVVRAGGGGGGSAEDTPPPPPLNPHQRRQLSNEGRLLLERAFSGSSDGRGAAGDGGGRAGGLTVARGGVAFPPRGSAGDADLLDSDDDAGGVVRGGSRTEATVFSDGGGGDAHRVVHRGGGGGGAGGGGAGGAGGIGSAIRGRAVGAGYGDGDGDGAADAFADADAVRNDFDLFEAARVGVSGGGGGGGGGGADEAGGYDDDDAYDDDDDEYGPAEDAAAQARRDAERGDEMEALEAILGDELAVEDTHVLSVSFDAAEAAALHADPTSDVGEAPSLPRYPVQIRFFLPEAYPDAVPAFELNTGGLFPRKSVEKRRILASIAALLDDRRGDASLFDAVDAVRDECTRAAEARLAAYFAPSPGLLAAEEAAAAKLLPVPPADRPGGVAALAGLPAHEARSPLHYVEGLVDILRRMAATRGVHVVRVENTLRQDLAIDFERRCAEIAEKRGAAHARVLTAFHGTAERNVASIVRQGLLVPSRESGISVATGSRFGVGIYVSPDPQLSLCYSRGSGRLLVCAVVPGVPFVCHTNVWGGGRRKGFDSHMSHDGQQIVLFKRSQVLPCFVVHYHTEAQRGTRYMRVTGGGTIVRARGLGDGTMLRHEDHARSMREAMHAARLKNGEFFFAGRFKVLDVAPADDDDDDTPVHLLAARHTDDDGRPSMTIYDGPADGEAADGEYQDARHQGMAAWN
uniref:RWD domain-containing protein n=1 Tax=Bicosoecida sp. CB-2014 TaxID=1486930 RepID=A0A7S1G9J4_9STRA